MEWHIMNAGGVTSLCSNLGDIEDGVFVPSYECAEILDSLLDKIQHDTITSFSTHRELFYLGFVEKDLVPMFKSLENDHGLFSKSIRLLAHLTQPFDLQNPQIAKNVQMIQDLKLAAATCKMACYDKKLLSVVIDGAIELVKEAEPYDIDEENCETITQCLFLLRNLLQLTNQEDDRTLYEGNYRMLFECGLEKLILTLACHNQRKYWATEVIQVIWLLCRGNADLIMGTEENVAHYDEDDDVTNTTNHPSQLISKYGPEIEWENMRDIFDEDEEEDECSKTSSSVSNLGHSFTQSCALMESQVQRQCRQNKHSFDSDMSDCFEQSGEANVKTATESDSKADKDTDRPLGLFLRDFISEFLKTGFCRLVTDIQGIILMKESSLDDSFLLWSVAFFLKFALKKEVPLDSVKSLLSTELVGYVVYMCVFCTEQIKTPVKSHQKQKNESSATKLHLLVSTLQSVFKLVKFYSRKGNSEDKEYLVSLKKNLGSVQDLQNVFILLVRSFRPEIQSIEYLGDLVLCVHLYLDQVDHWIKSGLVNSSTCMQKYVEKYATFEIMHKYGLMLEHYQTSSVTLNNAVLTMMYHVSGDCGNPDALLQELILNRFLEIMDSDFYVTQEIVDLMEYLLEYFIGKAQTDPYACALHMFTESMDTEEKDNEDERNAQGKTDDFMNWKTTKENANNFSKCDQCEWSRQESDLLMNMYMEFMEDEDMISKIMKGLQEYGYSKTEAEIIHKMEKENLLLDNEGKDNFDSEEKANFAGDRRINGMEEYDQMKCGDNIDKTMTNIDITEHIQGMSSADIVSYCVEKLSENQHKAYVQWLQRIFCESAYIKLGDKVVDKSTIEEPVLKFYDIQHLPLPIVLYEEFEEEALQNPYFILLQQHLGVQMPDLQNVFPRIPQFWTPEQLIEKASQLGPLRNDILKFDPECIKDTEVYKEGSPVEIQKKKSLRDTRRIGHTNCGVTSSLMWTKFVQQYNSSL